MEGSFDFHNTATILLAFALHRLFHQIRTFDYDTAFFAIDLDDLSAFAFIFACDNLDGIVLLYLDSTFDHIDGSLQDLGRKGYNFHVILFAQFPGYRPENAFALWIFIRINNDAGVVVETNIRTVRSPIFLMGSNYYRFFYGTLFYGGSRKCILHGHHNNITDTRVFALGTAKHLNALNDLRSGVVGNV
jgi:hypothetical protein